MSLESILGPEVESEALGFLKLVFKALQAAKDNPQLLGVILAGSGLGLRLFAGPLDFVIWDFTGNHTPSLAAQATPSDPTKPASPSNPTWLSIFQGAVIGEFTGLFQGSLTGSIGGTVNAANPQLGAQLGLAPMPSGSPAAILLGILGIPPQVTLSEVLILGGILAFMSPMFASLGGAIASAISKAIPI